MNHPLPTPSCGVIELRRYRIQAGRRQHFARYFESYFPEAFQQLGAIAVGHFCEREQDDHFTWLRAYPDMPARLRVNTAFYDGPVWQEHKGTLNALIADSDNVLLLRPLHADSAPPVLRAVDPLYEAQGAQGLVLAQILTVESGSAADLARAAEPWFLSYRGTGVVEAGILTTLDVPNNFPRHPVRSDAHCVVWLGVVRNDAALAQLRPRMEQAAAALADAGLLGADSELLVLEPTPRSRLRWAPVHHTMAGAA